MQEQGFKIEMVDFDIVDGLLFNKISVIKNIYNVRNTDLFKDYIANKKNNSIDYKRSEEIIIENFKGRLRLLGLCELDNIEESKFKDIICDDVKFEKYAKSLLLFVPYEELLKQEQEYFKNELKLVAKDNMIYERLITLKWLRFIKD